jgi:hypothetical protein
MEYPPNAVPNEGVDAIAIFLCVLTETTKAEPVHRNAKSMQCKLSASLTIKFYSDDTQRRQKVSCLRISFIKKTLIWMSTKNLKIRGHICSIREIETLFSGQFP